MTDKRSIGSRIFILADQYNIEQVRVSSIISSYISLCRDLIVDGFEVTFSDLVTVVPDSDNVRYKTTLAYQCKKVAESCGINLGMLSLKILSKFSGIISGINI